MRNGEGLHVWVSARNGDCGLEFTSEYRVTSNFDFQQDGKAVARDEVLGW